MVHSSPAVHHAPPDPRRWQALTLISVAQFMLILDVTVVNVALPDIGADLGLGRATLTWVVTAYTLFFGGLMLLGGRLADLFGTRRLMLTGLGVFVLASLTSGLASDAALLVGGRIGQGVGAALLSPAALATVTTTFHGAERNRALGVWAAIGGAGSAIGVLLGGALTAGPGWRWIFFINVPVGLTVLVALPLAVRARTAPPERQRVDLPGALLVTAATASLIYGLVNAGDAGWGDVLTVAALAAAVILYTVFTMIERSVRSPLMRVRLLAQRPVLSGAFLMLVATGLLIGLFFLGSFYLQRHQGFSALLTGLLFLPVAIGTGVGAHLGGHLVGRLDGRVPAVTGLALAAIGTGLVALFGMSPGVLVTGLVIASIGLGAVFVSATTTALALVAHHESGLASGVVNTFHELGGAIGVAVVSSLAAPSLTGHGLTGFTSAFTAWAVTGVVAALVAIALVPSGRLPVLDGPHVH
ncbi:MFS transporter [Microtetraspora sp. NBRC 16547]|uniref:MFS transporter n=1 Tax=Microtetraspora sp. NBRC 16547 TaxID=3030993 RepID=UPI0024A1EB69|nr:MFS transporter [Microtetraspora sp. NBRC 16547]GLX02006.1 MFS transporter [Microtetraspora sp. NBRC 16547]